MSDLDILDLDSLVKDYEAGKLNHLLKEEKKIKKPKQTTRVKAAKESFAVFYIHRITCLKCGKITQYCVGQGVKDIYSDKVLTHQINDANKSKVLRLIAEKKTENFYSDIKAEFCEFCSKFLTTEPEE